MVNDLQQDPLVMHQHNHYILVGRHGRRDPCPAWWAWAFRQLALAVSW